MNFKNFLILVLVIVSNAVFAQQSLNGYKYVIVPKTYDFLRGADQYQLNSLTKFLFKREGFETLFDTNSKPQNLANNPCLGLSVKLKTSPGMFNTKLVIELVNCRNETVHTSTEGKSKEKEYKKAYHEALRKAFQSIIALEYKYNSAEAPVVVEKEEVVEVQEPIAIVAEVTPVKVETAAQPVEAIEEVTLIEDVEEEVIENVPFAIVLYAQANPLGFQLVDSDPKVMYVLLKSSKKDLYFLKNKNGIVFKQNNKWFVEFYNEDKLIKHELHIKF